MPPPGGGPLLRAVNGVYGKPTIAAANAWQTAHGFAASQTWSSRHWVTLLSAGPRPVLKTGSAGPAVRNLQRALNAASSSSRIVVTGVWNAPTETALKAWQGRHDLPATGIMAASSWAERSPAAADADGRPGSVVGGRPGSAEGRLSRRAAQPTGGPASSATPVSASTATRPASAPRSGWRSSQATARSSP